MWLGGLLKFRENATVLLDAQSEEARAKAAEQWKQVRDLAAEMIDLYGKTVTESSVRGAGRSRGGATDTTMLIWKVIAANPGITRAEIWERVEHSIPDGYARRLYVAHKARKYQASDDAGYLRAARRGLLSKALWTMVRLGSLAKEGDGYRSLRKPAYQGNPETVDETGTKAAEHMALADALRVAEKWLARAKPDRADRNGRPGPILGPPSRKEYEALMLLVTALRVKGSTEA